jgi:rubredoxin
MRTGGGHWSSSRWAWPLAWVSIIPFFFLISVILLLLFIIRERGLEKKGRAPLLKMSLFSSRGFNVGMFTLGVLAFGQFGLSSAQLNNIIISSARLSDAGEASAASVTIRQIGASIGVAVIGAVLAAAFVTNATAIITSDKTLPGGLKAAVIRNMGGVNFDSGRFELPPHTAQGDAGMLKIELAKTYLPVYNSLYEGGSMKKYKCTICDYVYDPAEGDPDSGIAAGTAFEKLPDDWVCPVCGASKEDFEVVKE